MTLRAIRLSASLVGLGLVLVAIQAEGQEYFPRMPNHEMVPRPADPVAIELPGAAFSQTETKLVASDAAAGYSFGWFVSVYADTAVVGMRYYGVPGSAYVFTRDGGGTWSEQAKLVASDGAVGDHFGEAVSVYGDTAVVGALEDDSLTGSAYVFTRDAGGTWSEQAKLVAADAAAFALFGKAVAVYGDTVAVGAPYDNEGEEDAGAAYVFTRVDETTWVEEAKLVASDAGAEDSFGYSLSLFENTLVVGAYRDDSLTGSAYVFIRAEGGWSQQAKLTASDAAPDTTFGRSVSIHRDTVVVGADFDDSFTGSAYVFTRDAGGNWSEEAKLVASDAAPSDSFGTSVAVYGKIAVVGATGDDDGGNTSGSAYVFAPDGEGTWTERTKLVASDAAQFDALGRSVSVSGEVVLVGASGDDDGGEASGAAYVFSWLIFSDGFESGDTTAWSATVGGGA